MRAGRGYSWNCVSFRTFAVSLCQPATVSCRKWSNSVHKIVDRNVSGNVAVVHFRTRTFVAFICSIATVLIFLCSFVKNITLSLFFVIYVANNIFNLLIIFLDYDNDKFSACLEVFFISWWLYYGDVASERSRCVSVGAASSACGAASFLLESFGEISGMLI